jgi:hypothetical protein
MEAVVAKDKPTRAEREELEGPAIDLNPAVETESRLEAGGGREEGVAAAPPAIAEPVAPPAASEAPQGSNRQTDPPPMCPACNVKCTATHSEPMWTWYKCTNPQCPIGTRGYTEKKLRPFARAKVLQARRRIEPDEPYAAR